MGGRPGYSSKPQIHRTASSSSWISSLPLAIPMDSRLFLSLSSSWARRRRLVTRLSSGSSSGSEDKDALGVDFVDEGLIRDRVFLSPRPELLEDVEDCWDWGCVPRALDDLRGEGGAIEGRTGRR
jgi:hypothetical protein